jgi:hypothetical protein
MHNNTTYAARVGRFDRGMLPELFNAVVVVDDDGVVATPLGDDTSMFDGCRAGTAGAFVVVDVVVCAFDEGCAGVCGNSNDYHRSS